MQTVRLTLEANAAEAIAQAIGNIEAGNAMCAKGKKLCDTGKAYLAAQLKDLRGIEVEKLAIGEIVSVSVNGAQVFNVVIGKQNRVNLALLESAHPEIAKECKQDFPTVSYKRAV